MCKRRNWTSVKTQLPVNRIAKNYKFLTSGLNPSKTKVMVMQKWSEIADAFNALRLGTILLTAEQILKNDLNPKSGSEKAVSQYNMETRRARRRHCSQNANQNSI